MLSIAHKFAQNVLPLGRFGMAGAIQQINSINEITASLQSLTSSDLLVLDVDATILTPMDSVLRGDHSSPSHPMHVVYSMDSARSEHLYSICYSRTRYRPVEDDMIKQVNSLRGRVPIIALTAFETPSYGIVKDTVAARHDELNSIGLDLSNGTDGESIHLAAQSCGTRPLFSKGVLFSGKADKGLVLDTYLTHYGLNPRRIVAIDNTKRCLDSIMDKMAEKAECYHYLGENQLPSTLSPAEAQLQVDHFLKTEEWLSEEEIKCRFQ